MKEIEEDFVRKWVYVSKSILWNIVFNIYLKENYYRKHDIVFQTIVLFKV